LVRGFSLAVGQSAGHSVLKLGEASNGEYDPYLRICLHLLPIDGLESRVVGVSALN